MVVLLATGVVDRVAAVWACALAMIVTRCLSGTEARRAVNWQILIVVATSLGIAAAVQSTGLATRAVELITPGEGASLMGMLFMLFLLAAAAGQLVTPYGAAVLLFPFTMQLAASAGADPVPFVFTLMVAVGCPFINPVGYQTNLMVFGPGGYRFSDFARVGLPLTLILAVVTAVLAPMVYG
jgi:di/tricarboxylate transporter